MARTKIVATIGPASRDATTLRKMIDAGMNVARVNFSHGSHRVHGETIQTIRQVAAAAGRTVAILGDLQGPKLRLGLLDGDALTVTTGQQIVLTPDGEGDTLPFPHPELYSAMQPGTKMVIGDDEVTLTVLDQTENRITCEATLDGVMKSRKGVNMPGTTLPIPTITKKDKRDLEFICDMELDYCALSFVRAAEDVDLLRSMMAERGARIPIIAKIEKFEALNCLDDIAKTADGMMVARGDLGIDIPPQEVPIFQKRMIQICNQHGIPVITATQMLQSMEESPTPTRAEASDVANAILDGTDAVMLSGESAMGSYPVEAVRMMHDIALITEANFPYHRWELDRRASLDDLGKDVTNAISGAAVGLARRMEAKAIVTATMSGYTAKQVARFRPETPIVAVSPLSRTHRHLALVWGVQSVGVPRFTNTDEMIEETIAAVAKLGAQVGDRMIVTAGVPFGKSGATNLLEVHEITEDELAPS